MSARSRSTRPTGTCCVCGKEALLTFEHVPPRSAFNGREVFAQTLAERMKDIPPELQPGAGEYSLCESCNQETGSRYGTCFVDFCRDAMLVLENVDEYCQNLSLPG